MQNNTSYQINEKDKQPKENIEFKLGDFIPGYGIVSNALQFRGKGFKHSKENLTKGSLFVLYHAVTLELLYEGGKLLYNTGLERLID